MDSEAAQIAKLGGIIAGLIIIARDSRSLLSVKPVRKLFASTSFFWAPRDGGRDRGQTDRRAEGETQTDRDERERGRRQREEEQKKKRGRREKGGQKERQRERQTETETERERERGEAQTDTVHTCIDTHKHAYIQRGEG